MKLFTQARKYGAKIVVASSLALMGTAAMAADGDNPIVVIVNSIGLAGVAAAIAALALVIIGIALTLQGPVVGKRIIKQI